jgi:hypothetical protein
MDSDDASWGPTPLIPPLLHIRIEYTQKKDKIGHLYRLVKTTTTITTMALSWAMGPSPEFFDAVDRPL